MNLANYQVTKFLQVVIRNKVRKHMLVILKRQVPAWLKAGFFWPKSTELTSRRFHNVKAIMTCLPYYAKGLVVRGFGRGSKELGIPTANLPDNVVSQLPSQLDTGIYYGLSNVNSGEVYDTVLSVGWNPFYKNTKKSMEAHLIHKFNDDFYGSELKLVILGFIRPEMNYSSLDLLIEAINNDIETAKKELSKPEFQTFKNESFFKKDPNLNCDNVKNGGIIENGK